MRGLSCTGKGFGYPKGMSIRALLFALPPLMVCASLHAQRPAAQASLSVETSAALPSDAMINGQASDELSTAYTSLQWRNAPLAVGAGQLQWGVGGMALLISEEANLPVPDDQWGGSVELGYSQRLGQDKQLITSLRPTYFGDGFNLTGLGLIRWQVSPTFAWSGGVIFSVQGDRPVLPVVGFRWQPNETWSVNFGAPRTEVAYAFSPTLVTSLGVSFVGADFKVKEVENLNPQGRDLSNTWVDYREIRVGPSVRWTALPTLELGLEAGLQVDRRFDFHEKDYELRTKDSPYVGLSVRSQF